MKTQNPKPKIQNPDKGVSIYLTLMIMFILLAVGLGISTILVSQMKMIKGMGDSVIAFYAADTGIERILYEALTCYQAGCSSPPCYAPAETTCLSPCRPDCWGLLEGRQFSDSLNEANYVATHTHCPDFNGDGVVTYPPCGDCIVCPDTPGGLRHDLCMFLDRWAKDPTWPNWHPKFDFTGDGWVDMTDYFVLMETGDGGECSGYNNFKSSGEVRETKRAIEVVR